jgi:hypothetical protein
MSCSDGAGASKIMGKNIAAKDSKKMVPMSR